MTENLLRILLAILALLIIAATAAAQSWGEAQGSSIVRVQPAMLGTPYDRPGIFFLGRPAKALPPQYAYTHPYGTLAVAGSDRYMVREFRPVDRNGAAVYTDASHRFALIHKTRARDRKK